MNIVTQSTLIVLAEAGLRTLALPATEIIRPFLPCFPEIVLRLRGILDRFLNAVGCMDACFVSDSTLETLPQPAHVGQTKVGGIDLNKPRMRRVADALLALASSPTGFTASDLAEKVRAMSGESDSA